jgi:hypothetical protein
MMNMRDMVEKMVDEAEQWKAAAYNAGNYERGKLWGKVLENIRRALRDLNKLDR